MKSVLISIQPKWASLICTFLGYDNRRPLYKKRLDLRKSVPETTPFKAFIYESKGKKVWKAIDIPEEQGGGAIDIFEHEGSGKVIGEFICDYVVRHCEMANADLGEEMSCVPREDILKYSNGKEVFGWHVSDLKIYDEPRALSEFGKYGFGLPLPLRRPPQSWMYVEELI